MFKINRNVSLASAFPSERLGVGFEETLVGGFPVTLMRVESVHGRIRHVALRAEEKRGRVQRKTEDQRREPFKRDYRLRTQVVRVLEPMNKIWGKLDPLDVLANVVSKIARGTDDFGAGVADGSMDAGVDTDVVAQELDFAALDDCMLVQLVAIRVRVDRRQTFDLRGRCRSTSCKFL